MTEKEKGAHANQTWRAFQKDEAISGILSKASGGRE
jgi:hypothetical protein